MPDFFVNAFWITAAFLIGHVVLRALLSAAALGVRRLLHADHPARKALLAYAMVSPLKPVSFLKSPEHFLVYGFVSVLLLLTLSGA
ncbi:MAG: hypothetical protein JWM42_1738 [Burkholderia sp.]|jgi:hypothetical protein|nr:hypothetical protein [Burkholderia sp.]